MASIAKVSKSQQLEARYKGARGNLLAVVLFTLLNILLLISNSNTFFLFSAYIPYALIDLGMLFCGLYPVEYYGEYFPISETFGPSVFAVVVIAAIPLIVYFLAWIFSKKNKVGWVIVSLSMGISAGSKLKKLPPEEETDEAKEGTVTGQPDSSMLRFADNEVKHRVLLETEILGHSVIYRRVKKRTNW